MAVFPIAGVARRQPEGIAKPSADIGDAALLAQWGAGNYLCDALGAVALSSGTPGLVGSPMGRALNLVSASSQYVYWDSSRLGSSVAASQPFTIAVYAIPSNTTTRGALYANGYTVTDNPYIWLEINATAGKVSFNTRTIGVLSEIITTSNTFAAGVPMTAVAVSYAANSRKVYLNGQLSSAGVGVTNYAGDSWTLDRTAIGTILRATASTFLEGKVLIVAVIRRAWSDAEILRFNENPWRLFNDSDADVFFSPVAAGAFKAAWARGANSIIGAGVCR